MKQSQQNQKELPVRRAKDLNRITNNKRQEKNKTEEFTNERDLAD
jgi:hypothetical protein